MIGNKVPSAWWSCLAITVLAVVGVAGLVAAAFLPAALGPPGSHVPQRSTAPPGAGPVEASHGDVA